MSWSSMRISKTAATLAALAASALGCADATEPNGASGSGGSSASRGGSGGSVASGGAGRGGSGGSVGTSGGTGTGGSTTAGAAGASGSGATQNLPFAVDDFFIPSGFMGDGETPGSVTMLPDASPNSDRTCGGDRAVPEAVGVCHQVSYMTSGSLLWAGVFWQNPAGNWGDQPGYAIPPGAKRISFFAKGAAGGEVVKFVAGIQGALTYSDSFKLEQEITLSSEWTGYSLSLSAAYSQVIGAFGWVASGDPAAGVTLPVRFEVDHIRWE